MILYKGNTTSLRRLPNDVVLPCVKTQEFACVFFIFKHIDFNLIFVEGVNKSCTTALKLLIF